MKEDIRKAALQLKSRLETLRSAGVEFLPLSAAPGGQGTTEPAGVAPDSSPCPCGPGRAATGAVKGAGRASRGLVFVGGCPDGPSSAEEVPFSERSEEGRTLTRVVEDGLGLTRGKVYVTYAVKCEGPAEPTEEEVRACGRLLAEELDQLGPKVVVALGPVATFALLGSSDVSALRGRFHDAGGFRIIPTHGTEDYGDDALKREAWEDLKLVIRGLGLPGPGR